MLSFKNILRLRCSDSNICSDENAQFKKNAYRRFHAKSPPPLALFSAKKGGGDLERHFDFQPISAKKGGGGLSAPFIFFCENRLK